MLRTFGTTQTRRTAPAQQQQQWCAAIQAGQLTQHLLALTLLLMLQPPLCCAESVLPTGWVSRWQVGGGGLEVSGHLIVDKCSAGLAVPVTNGVGVGC
jgi:hypothetical protein